MSLLRNGTINTTGLPTSTSAGSSPRHFQSLDTMNFIDTSGLEQINGQCYHCHQIDRCFQVPAALNSDQLELICENCLLSYLNSLLAIHSSEN